MALKMRAATIHPRRSLFAAIMSATTSALRLRALRAFVVETDADRAGFQVAAADDEHGVDAQLFRVLNFRARSRFIGVDGITAEVGAHADHLSAQFVGDVLRVFHERGGRGIVFRANGDDTHLIGCERESEVPT